MDNAERDELVKKLRNSGYGWISRDDLLIIINMVLMEKQNQPNKPKAKE